jgi:hypothetical protein
MAGSKELLTQDRELFEFLIEPLRFPSIPRWHIHISLPFLSFFLCDLLAFKMYPVKGRRSVFAVVIVLTVIFLVFHKQRSSHSYWSAFYKTGTRPIYGYEEAHPATSYKALPDDFTLEEYPVDEAYEKAKGNFVEVATNVTTETFSPNGGFGIVGDTWDSSHLQALCEKTKVWEGSVVFECLDLTGSVVDVRQALLTCLRYAIEAGAGKYKTRLLFYASLMLKLVRKIS